MDKLTWTCHICGDERLDGRISVKSTTRSTPTGEYTENVRHCNDRVDCVRKAETFSFSEKAEDD